MFWILFLFLGALCAAEIFLRRRTKWHVTDYLLSDEEVVRLAKNFDPELGWINTFSGVHGERKMVSSRGLPFMLTFGDSFVFGDEVSDHETWQSQLTERLPGDVYNFGVNGYGLDQAFLRFRRTAPHLKAPHFALGLTRAGIHRIVNSYRKFLFPATGIPLTKPRYSLEDDRVTLLANPIESRGQLRRLQQADFVTDLCRTDFWGRWRRDQKPTAGFMPLLLLNPALWKNLFRESRSTELRTPFTLDLWQDPEVLNLIREILRNFSDESKKLGAIPWLLLFPERHDVETHLSTKKPSVPALCKICRELDLSFFDGVSALAQAATNQARPLGDFYASGGHLSVRGNQVVAEELEKVLNPPKNRPSSLL